MAPIHGVVTIAYIPNGYVVGISKLARVVEAYARRLQIQEKMTAQIATCIQENLHPLGVAVMIKATHHCMLGRGVNVQGAVLFTQHFTGALETDDALRADIKQLMV
jgi:GTP cyclohydrolase I